MNDDEESRLAALEAGMVEMKSTINELCAEVERIIRLVEGSSFRAA